MNSIKKTKSILYSMEFSHGMRRTLIGSLALIYFIYLGFNVFWVTTLFSISVLIMTFFEFPTGAIADYDSRKKSILISFMLMSVAFFGLFFFRSFWLLALSWILGDIAWTFYSGSGSAWAIDALKIAKQKSKIVNLISREYLFEKSGYFIGGLIGMILVSISFNYVWLFVSLNYLVMFFVILFYMEERNFKPVKTKHGYFKKSIIKAEESFKYILHKGNRELRVLMIAAFFAVITISSFFIGVPLLLTEIFNLNKEYLPTIYSVSGAIALIGPLISEKIVKKKGFRKPLSVLHILMGISIIVFGISGSIVASIISLFALGVFLACSDIMVDSAYHHEFSSKIRASLGSVNNIIWAIAHSIAVFFTGLSIVFFGVIITILISGGVSIITALIYFMGLKRE